ncbi:hypothetical protein EVAR_30087_1 [Eumeta japonica]|uniref:Uncharacterized protein n=1 Tax=Eumeta variegata TaxID=151549 RepID=A0A4C1X7Q3_EUMVA|nr:hypothetical protein EVAR_30087_1 [Eumeta japonica]
MVLIGNGNKIAIGIENAVGTEIESRVGRGIRYLRDKSKTGLGSELHKNLDCQQGDSALTIVVVIAHGEAPPPGTAPAQRRDGAAETAPRLRSCSECTACADFQEGSFEEITDVPLSTSVSLLRIRVFIVYESRGEVIARRHSVCKVYKVRYVPNLVANAAARRRPPSKHRGTSLFLSTLRGNYVYNNETPTRPTCTHTRTTQVFSRRDSVIVRLNRGNETDNATERARAQAGLNTRHGQSLLSAAARAICGLHALGKWCDLENIDYTDADCVTIERASLTIGREESTGEEMSRLEDERTTHEHYEWAPCSSTGVCSSSEESKRDSTRELCLASACGDTSDINNLSDETAN